MVPIGIGAILLKAAGALLLFYWWKRLPNPRAAGNESYASRRDARDWVRILAFSVAAGVFVNLAFVYRLDQFLSVQFAVGTLGTTLMTMLLFYLSEKVRMRNPHQ
jgi:hypothetical protein